MVTLKFNILTKPDITKSENYVIDSDPNNLKVRSPSNTTPFFVEGYMILDVQMHPGLHLSNNYILRGIVFSVVHVYAYAVD